MAQLPDILVFGINPNNDDTVMNTLAVIRRAVTTHDALPFDRAGLMIVPVLPVSGSEATIGAVLMQ